jgi:hypothetical protein
MARARPSRVVARAWGRKNKNSDDFDENKFEVCHEVCVAQIELLMTVKRFSYFSFFPPTPPTHP